MNILTFDLEDWFHCDFYSDITLWDKYESRVLETTEKILNSLDKRNIKATFFILGWIAKKYPEIVRKIDDKGHEIGSHSYAHMLVHRLQKKEFEDDTKKSINLIQNITGKKITIFRAPGFSITNETKWAFEILNNLEISVDCSIFPSNHDYGGFKKTPKNQPFIIKGNNYTIKEFPLNFYSTLGFKHVYSGGGFFRLYPWILINYFIKKSNYVMTYFHPRDFDPGQPLLKHLTMSRKFKSYYGLAKSFEKFERMLNNNEFITVGEAEKKIDWENANNFIIND